jgi:multimeric flavodoxin WrbA
MKVVAFNGSPKKDGNTYQAIRIIKGELEAKGIEVGIVQVGNKAVSGCLACGLCAKNMDDRCAIRGNEVNEWIELMKEADGIILGSPVYFSGVNGTMKSFLDRAGYVLASRQGAMRYKVGVAVTAVRRSGGSATLDTLNHYIQFFEMLMPASNYWNIIHGRLPGEARQDDEGRQIMRILGRNMAWLMQVVEQGKNTIPLPETEEKIATHFIR